MIQYQILQTFITRTIWQTLRRITNEILGVKVFGWFLSIALHIMYCAWYHIIKPISISIPRTWYCLSMDQVKRCNRLYLLNEHSDYVLFPIILVHKAITQRSKSWPWKEWLKEHFELILFKFVCYSHKLYIKFFHTLETYYLSSFFSNYSKMYSELMKWHTWLVPVQA